MDQLHSFADSRLVVGCLYCSAPTENSEHVPSRVLLDEPYPENLPTMPSCLECNAGFSLDEEYFACLIECARTGSVDAVTRPKIQKILEHSPALAARIMRARTVSQGGEISFQLEAERVKNVVVKLANGHAVYELDEQRQEDPTHIMVTPLHTLSPEALQHFETIPQSAGLLASLPEIGTRAMQRVLIAAPANSVFGSDWVVVQEGQYRYAAIADGPVMVRFVIGEYLACEVIWGMKEEQLEQLRMF
jgi:hypothetical protein